jgi:hypothetical protein
MAQQVQERITKSSSVEAVFRGMRKDVPVDASEIVRRLFRFHGEYAAGLAASAHLQDTGSTRLPEDWLSEIETLYEVSHMQGPDRKEQAFQKEQPARLSSSPKLNGRLVILGLSLLEPVLYRQLKSAGIFDSLASEIDYALEEILTNRGRKSLEILLAAEVSSPRLPEESVPSLSDNPLGKGDEDLLGRIPFARFLARRIQAISARETGAYSIHIKGQWGSGKSSLLNFLRNELEGSGQWLVTDFNAWRNQQIRPPWWALMEKVFRDVEGNLSIPSRLAEYWWRFNTGRLLYILTCVTLLWILALIVPFWAPTTSQPDFLFFASTWADNLSKILALVATVWGGLIAINRSLLFSSARAAQDYTELVNNPTEQIKNRFETLIRRLRPRRLAILIDDLDRCQSEYVVELLEGIQTLYREAPVVFIVAADEKWLNACYEQIYEKLSQRVGEPGKMLGSLFLEKAFRFSTPMPGIPKELREKFWRHLLAMKSKDEQTDPDEIQRQADERVRGARTEQELGTLVNDSKALPFAEERAVREAAVVRLAANEVQERLEHTLEPYYDLLEPNPRSMKRFVNSFSANRALAILSEVEIDLHQLALWTVLSSRWPSWADTFARKPELFEKVRKNDRSDLKEDIKHILEEEELQTVINGAGLGTPLDIDILTKSAKMQA